MAILFSKIQPGTVKRAKMSNGYIRVRVGKGHHLADKGGWALEHRLIAESSIGRRLLPGEIVHHKDGDKSNNAPENLEVLPSQRHHGATHRSDGSPIVRGPDEANFIVACACGCGATFEAYATDGTRRRFVHNHHSRLQGGSAVRTILAALADGAVHTHRQLQAVTELSRSKLSDNLSRLKERGRINNGPLRYQWRLTNGR